MSLTTAIRPSIYLIADHLDAVLAHGEDLIAMQPPADIEPSSSPAYLQLRRASQRVFLDEVRATETRLVARILKAREHSEHVRRFDPRLELVTNLFVASTATLADAAADLADTTALDFQNGRDSMAYMRSRSLISREATVAPSDPALKIGETFVVAATVELGAVLDLAAAYLDALELHYDLYGEPKARKAASPAHDSGEPVRT